MNCHPTISILLLELAFQIGPVEPVVRFDHKTAHPLGVCAIVPRGWSATRTCSESSRERLG